MKITRYEIDMLSLGAADSIIIHFYDDLTSYEYVVLIDGGNYSDGPTVARHIKKYTAQGFVDLAIVTHPDKDHFGGIQYLLEKQRDNHSDSVGIREIWVDDPGNHITVDDVKYYRSPWNVREEARSVFDCEGDNLINILNELGNGIVWKEPFYRFASVPYDKNEVYYAFDGAIRVLGPTKSYYESLVPRFRHDMKPFSYTDDGNDNPIMYSFSSRSVTNKTIDSAYDDPSSHNQSSVIVMFSPSNGKNYLFMGDAGREAFDNLDRIPKIMTMNAFFLKVPHHGSKHNIDSNMINWINPKVSYISTEKCGKYLSTAVSNTLKKKGSLVYTTMDNWNQLFRVNMPPRDGYIRAESL